MKWLKRIALKIGINFKLYEDLKDPKNTVTIYSNGMLLNSDGESSDMLPVSFCNEKWLKIYLKELGDIFNEDLLGEYIKAKETNNE